MFRVDVALPCATQNELDAKDAATLIKNGVICVAEGANMLKVDRRSGDAFRTRGHPLRPGQGKQCRRSRDIRA